MTIRYTLSLLVVLILSGTVDAQDFEADSIYYTPISKKTGNKPTPKKIFEDTITRRGGFEYFFNVQVGSLVGCNDCGQGKDVTTTATTVHGVTIGRKLRVGGGIGLDSYRAWQTLPIFGSVSWDLLGTRNTQALFVQFQYGWAAGAWRRHEPWDTNFEVDGRQMINPGIGYRIKYHDVTIALAAGAKIQRVLTTWEYPSYYYTQEGMWVEGTPNKTTIREDMSRFMITMVIGWK